ncbi:MAG: NAD(P)-dependent oxidoreductase [Rhodospirillales bacterium]|nr:NAD(P)-dependent oxidoreductase [Rhodospirillales bacterium]
MAAVAFLGTGNMGAGMAGRLIAAGHALAVYNRTAARTQPLAKAGARVCRTPREAADGADAVFAMVGDDEASAAVWLGDDGALAAAKKDGTLAIECSTLSHDWVLDLAEKARAKGWRYIDCPVTGIPVNAAAGELTLFVGADDADLEAARPLLEPLAKEIIQFGPVGAGTAYKLMVNLMGAVQIAGAAEGLLIAEKAGLDPETVSYALARGAAASPQVVRNIRRMTAGDHDRNVTFSGRLRLKDVLYGLRLADKLGQQTPFGRAARDAFQRLLDQGLEELNESKVIDVLRS